MINIVISFYGYQPVKEGSTKTTPPQHAQNYPLPIPNYPTGGPIVPGYGYLPNPWVSPYGYPPYNAYTTQPQYAGTPPRSGSGYSPYSYPMPYLYPPTPYGYPPHIQVRQIPQTTPVKADEEVDEFDSKEEGYNKEENNSETTP